MKIKNIQLSLVVLFMLAIASFAFYVKAEDSATTTKNIFLDSDQDGLSDEEEKTYGTDPRNADTDGDGYSDGAEIKSGYNPLKQSPEDKILPETSTVTTPVAASDSDQKNMTAEITQKIASIANSTDPENQDVSLEQIKGIVEESLSTQVTEADLPEITEDDIIIKKEEKTKGLSETEIKEAQKKDFTDYIVGVSYVLSSNSSVPLTSSSNITAVSNSLMQDLTTVITSKDPQTVDKLLATEQKTFDQIKNIPVPESLVETHLKALRMVKYAESLKDIATVDPTDPMASIANLSKINGFLNYASTFSDEMTQKFDSYGLTFDDSVKSTMTSYGMDLPDATLTQQLTTGAGLPETSSSITQPLTTQ